VASLVVVRGTTLMVVRDPLLPDAAADASKAVEVVSRRVLGQESAGDAGAARRSPRSVRPSLTVSGRGQSGPDLSEDWK
jgi:hypothetical protein